MKKLGNLLLLVAMCLMFSVTAKADTSLTEVVGGIVWKMQQRYLVMLIM